jgi:hypothetical protein
LIYKSILLVVYYLSDAGLRRLIKPCRLFTAENEADPDVVDGCLRLIIPCRLLILEDEDEMVVG